MGKLSNDTFRNYILKSIIFNNEIIDADVNEDVHYYLFAQKLNEYRESDDLAIYFLYISIITVAFLDTYKLLNTKLNEGRLTSDEEVIYDHIAYITSIEELQIKIDENEGLLEHLINRCVEFIRMNDLRKITTIKKLSEGQKHNLRCDFELFENDLEQYDYREKMPVEILTKYYAEEMDKTLTEHGIIDPGNRSSNLMTEIMGFIKMLAGYDYETFEELMQDIIVLDYKWNKYIIDKGYSLDTILMDEIQGRLDMYEENSIDTLIQEIFYDSYYFQSLIDSMILIKCDNMYVDENLLSEEMVEDYYMKHVIKSKK
ncbi:MAG: hypothetical protein J6B98_07255 [Bacilli bacterium]|nr:hypothetical protein [Bacilli bacterium]